MRFPYSGSKKNIIDTNTSETPCSNNSLNIVFFSSKEKSVLRKKRKKANKNVYLTKAYELKGKDIELTKDKANKPKRDSVNTTTGKLISFLDGKVRRKINNSKEKAPKTYKLTYVSANKKDNKNNRFKRIKNRFFLASKDMLHSSYYT